MSEPIIDSKALRELISQAEILGAEKFHNRKAAPVLREIVYALTEIRGSIEHITSASAWTTVKNVNNRIVALQNKCIELIDAKPEDELNPLTEEEGVE